MPKSCAAYNCTNRFVKGNGISFHKFPLADNEKLAKWISAMRRKDFEPTEHTYICSKHFTPESFYEKHSRKILKEDAVPTLFDFSGSLEMVQKYRKSLRKMKTKYEKIINKKNFEIEHLKQKLRICKLEVRKSKKIKCLVDIIQHLKGKKMMNSEIAAKFEENFRELNILPMKKKSNLNSDEQKTFAVSLFFYSPNVYEYCRQSLLPSLPHPDTIR